MIAIAAGLILAVVVAGAVATFFASVSGSRPLGVVLALALTPTLAFLPYAVGAITDPGSEPPTATISHEQLEADRVMTQQMAVAVGPGMDGQMTANGMLRRSSSAAYVAALERHVAIFDRMAGVVP